MQISLFDSFTRQVTTTAITGYQKHISPHKGFACAHRILYGGESCSQYIKRVVAKEGLKAAFVNSRERFQACKQANQILRCLAASRYASTQTENSKEFPEEEAETQQRQQASGKVAQKSSFISSDNTNCFDCADLGCNCAEMVSMTPDCGSLDCGAADCSSLDCSGADCSFLDCGSCGS
ncbi:MULTISPECIES: membrane protein insertion efficiency factor YidD [unclassified Nostoc]|uniref:membrane protein insertion efficiency factor YidD n=1 Tax=unclassified Nostoc TaxID=2593658 RepID=UPI002AD2A278|nr:membrane protein insertion efficiency factor YidD [Nostoc sp. DedQUE03]MDZ7975316.1 membrane protein insertion efficiency factor YidD [Nostoc sp. DedQUE03]MDZ8048933.1 membrane protein insertion efficiency factor YidD [Nostoc sp. DedQUE02]